MRRRRRSPWAELAARPHIELLWASLPKSRGVIARHDGRVVILLHHGLSDREACAVLAHELVHEERGVPAVDLSPMERAAEEATVAEEVADWLVPPSDLLLVVGRLAASGEAVTVQAVAQAFPGAPEYVCATALGLAFTRAVEHALKLEGVSHVSHASHRHLRSEPDVADVRDAVTSLYGS